MSTAHVYLPCHVTLYVGKLLHYLLVYVAFIIISHGIKQGPDRYERDSELLEILKS